MPSFVSRVVTDSGVQNIKVDALDEIEAERLASRQGQVLSIKRRMNFDLVPGMKASERHTFMLRLSSMVGSKMSATESLKLMANTFGGRIRKCASQMVTKIENGLSLADAIDSDRKNFPVATAALVRAGIQGGETWKALRDAAEFEYLIAGIQKGAAKDFAVAIGTFFLSFGLMVGSVYYIGPQVTENAMFANSDAVNVGWVEMIGKWLVWIQAFMAFIVVLFAWLGTVGRFIAPNLADKIILSVPYYKDLVLSRNSYIVLYKLGLLVKSGVKMEEALALTAEGSPKGALRTDIERALSFIRNGKTWANALDTLHPTDRAALSSSTDREDTARTFDMLANQYKDLYMSRIQSFAPTVKTFAAACMIAAGGVLFGMVILPMLQFSASV